MAVLDNLLNPCQSHSFEAVRQELQTKIDETVVRTRGRVAALAEQNGDVVVELVSANNARLASLWEEKNIARDGQGVVHVAFTVGVMLLVGLLSPTSVTTSLAIAFAILVVSAVLGWIAKNADVKEKLRGFVSHHWSSLVFVDAIGEKAIYRATETWDHKCDFSRVTAVHCGEDEYGPYAAFREQNKVGAMLCRMRRPGDGGMDEARRIAAILETKGRTNNPRYYEEGASRAVSHGTHASL